jgi:hypothetical protein
MGRPIKPIVVSEEERAKLQEWARRPETALRARIVLGCADGMENRQVARELRITDQTVCRWRERFRTAGLEGRLLGEFSRPLVSKLGEMRSFYPGANIDAGTIIATRCGN